MSKNRYLIERTKLADKLYKGVSDGEELYRLFKIYHPVYEIEVNIETETVDETYHIIEKYMDKLICGYTEGTERKAGSVLIGNKDELFALLGINGEAYEIAEKFFFDLFEAGHFEITPMGLRSKEPAFRSLKLDRRVSEKTQMEKKLFDVFSMELMPAEFYETARYSVDSLTAEYSDFSDGALLCEDTVGARSVSHIENMVNNTDYVNMERIERGLPEGYKKMSVSAGGQAEVAFFPYYLAMFRKGTDYVYRAYRIDNGAEIPWMTVKYASSYYGSAVERINGLSASTTRLSFENPICRNFSFCKSGEPDDDNNVFKNQETGNYSWHPTDEQLADVLGLSEDKKLKKSACYNIANRSVTALGKGDMGKLVEIRATDEQKELLQNCMSAGREEIEELFASYLKATGAVDTEEE